MVRLDITFVPCYQAQTFGTPLSDQTGADARSQFVIAVQVFDMLGALHSRKRMIDSQLSETRRCLKRARAAQARADSLESKAWAIVGQMREIVLIAYIHADYQTEAAVVYMRSLGRQMHWPDRSDEELERLVTDLFLAADVEELVQLTSESATLHPYVMESAMSYVNQWRVASWVTLQNCKGIAPTSQAVLNEFESARLQLPGESRTPTLGLKADASTRKRLSRWRKRFGGRIGKIRAREEISADSLRFKVSRVCVSR